MWVFSLPFSSSCPRRPSAVAGKKKVLPRHDRGGEEKRKWSRRISGLPFENIIYWSIEILQRKETQEREREGTKRVTKNHKKSNLGQVGTSQDGENGERRTENGEQRTENPWSTTPPWEFPRGLSSHSGMILEEKNNQ